MRRHQIYLLIFLLILSFVLRVYRLDSVPPSLNWDEVDAGYNAYTIAHWGKDEWGQFLPLVFTSFRDDKHPVHIYITALFVGLFGLSDFTTRLPSALIGILSVFVIFYLAKILFKNDLAALFAGLFLAVSPYHIQFSRGLWEVNFALFFFMLGLLLFYLAIYKKGWLLNLSFLSFTVSILSYHSSIVVVPPILLLLILLYFNKLKKLSINFYSGIFILLLLLVLLITNPRILGLARIQQTQFSNEIIEKTQTYQKTKNHILGLGEIAITQYMTHFTPQYLFISGDQNPRNSVKTFGEFYKIDAILIILGFIFLLLQRSRVTLILFAWIALAPIPSSLVSGAPNATRALFMMGSLSLIAAFGAGSILSWFRGKIRLIVLVIIVVLLSIQAFSFLKYYFNVYPTKDPHDWQYGMKQSAEFVKSHPEYDQVYVTDIRSQPYIFFLFYLKTSLPEYLDTVVYNRSEESKSYNTVSYFENTYLTKEGQRKKVSFYFGGWDPIESMPNPGVLYIVTPSQYDGLRHKSEFSIKELIRYPHGGNAFFLVSAK